jgi:uncharacterized protein YbaP (TraB family)
MPLRLPKALIALAIGVAVLCGTAVAREHTPQPALWQIRAGQSTVYLFGSIHMLPRDWAWRTTAIDAAIASADSFVFETALTPHQLAKVSAFVRDRGKLPGGQRLSRRLSHRGLADFQKALALTPLDPDAVDAMRPWLALTVLGDYQLQNGPVQTYADEGVDRTIELSAQQSERPIRQLETAQHQLEMLVEARPDGDIARFEMGLREILAADDNYNRLLEAWTAGNQTGVTNVLAAEAARNPMESRLLLDRRNRNWLPQIEAMMISNETIFVTIGAAHLVGPGSVLDLLCSRGWDVQRMKTGPSVPPPACAEFEKPPRPGQVRLRAAALDQ